MKNKILIWSLVGMVLCSAVFALEILSVDFPGFNTNIIMEEPMHQTALVGQVFNGTHNGLLMRNKRLHK